MESRIWQEKLFEKKRLLFFAGFLLFFTISCFQLRLLSPQVGPFQKRRLRHAETRSGRARVEHAPAPLRVDGREFRRDGGRSAAEADAAGLCRRDALGLALADEFALICAT